jgi:hypothetical protein
MSYIEWMEIYTIVFNMLWKRLVGIEQCSPSISSSVVSGKCLSMYFKYVCILEDRIVRKVNTEHLFCKLQRNA